MMSASITSSHYGVTRDGLPVSRYTLGNCNNVKVSVISYGGIIESFRVPDRAGPPLDIVLGYDTLAQYEACVWCIGCTVGRYANRIANGEFELDGVHYALDKNNGSNHLHGGNKGFHKVVWDARIETGGRESASGVVNKGAGDNTDRLVLSYMSADGEEGYPGNLSVRVEYTLSDKNELKIAYTAITDKPTIVNLTNHSYFNLKGHQQGLANGVLDHQLQLSADCYVPIDHRGVPLGALHSVTDTPMDFRTGMAIGLKIGNDHPQLLAGSGYDHSWVLDDRRTDNSPVSAAILTDPAGERRLEVLTTQPGVQLYTANHLHNCVGKAGTNYGRQGSVCLETQHFADSPNQPQFPTTVLRPGGVFEETTVFHLTY